MEKIKTGVGHANGKIILIGEHSVVYRKPAIAFPLPSAYIEAEVTDSVNEISIECDFYSGLLTDMPELLDSLKKTVEICLDRLDKKNSRFKLVINSAIPAERGMGSSAAVAVATVRAIYDYFQIPLTQNELLDIVAVSEKIAHGNPSGLDALMTSSDTPYYYIKDSVCEPLASKLNAVLIVGDTGKTGRTKEAVQTIADMLHSDKSQQIQMYIDRLGRLTDDVRQCLHADMPQTLGQKMTEAHYCLQQLGASSPELDKLVMTALTHQALGAKLTGGGRGGCMIALAETKQAAANIAHALRNAGAVSTWLYEMGETL